jgi:hypothetical protein
MLIYIGCVNFVFNSRMRPRLPLELERMLPSELVHLIYTYVPHEKKQVIKYDFTLQKELTKIQVSPKSGKIATYMKGLEDFCLD